MHWFVCSVRNRLQDAEHKYSQCYKPFYIGPYILEATIDETSKIVNLCCDCFSFIRPLRMTINQVFFQISNVPFFPFLIRFLYRTRWVDLLRKKRKSITPCSNGATYSGGASRQERRHWTQARNIIYISTRWYWNFSCVILYLSDSTSRSSSFAIIIREIFIQGKPCQYYKYCYQ